MSVLKGGKKKSFDEFNLSANQSINVPCGPVTTQEFTTDYLGMSKPMRQNIY